MRLCVRYNYVLLRYRNWKNKTVICGVS